MNGLLLFMHGLLELLALAGSLAFCSQVTANGAERKSEASQVLDQVEFVNNLLVIQPVSPLGCVQQQQ